MTASQRVVRVSNEATFWKEFTDLLSDNGENHDRTSPSKVHRIKIRKVSFKDCEEVEILGQAYMTVVLEAMQKRNEMDKRSLKACLRGMKNIGGTW